MDIAHKTSLTIDLSYESSQGKWPGVITARLKMNKVQLLTDSYLFYILIIT